MRKIIIWILIVSIAIGFVYVGNNLIATNISGADMLDVLPDSNAIIKFNKRDAVGCLFPELSHSHFILPKNINKGYIILNDDNDAAAYVYSDNTISPFDSALLSLKDSGFRSIKTFWEKGFPVADGTSLNQEIFLSSWRKYKIYASNRDILEDVFNGILQKNKLIKENPDFSILWNKESNVDLQGFISSSGSNFMANNIKIPFLDFTYPLAFNYLNQKIVIENVSSNSTDSLNFGPYTFLDSILQLALPHTMEIKKNLLQSGLSFLIANKIGIPFDSLSLLSSYTGGEFVLFDRDNFFFMVKSTPADNSVYREELRNSLPNVKEEKILSNGFPMTHFNNNYVNFYTLEFPDSFFISTSKEILDRVANKNVEQIDKPGLARFMTVNKKFNDIVDLYNLNVKKYFLSNKGIQSCAIFVSQSGDRKITTIELR